MSAQDLEQRARELLVKWRYAEPANGSMASQNRRDAFRRCAKLPDEGKRRIVHSVSWRAEEVSPE